MIVVMKPGATDAQIEHVIELVREYGLKDHKIVGTDRTVVAAIGDKRMVDKGAIENAPMVEKIVPILAPYKMASTEVKQQRSQIAVGPEGFPLGGRKLAVIAGPCAVESEDQLFRTAEAVRQAGAMGLRGGAYKPRTSPYSFQGLGEKGLKLLAAARDRTGLTIVTEAVAVETLPAVAHYADVVQIGARNIQHYPLLEALGQIDKPVLLKRGLSSQLDEWLLAAEYIINAGNANVILCERGIRTYETFCRNTLNLTSVPALRERTHLPVIVDPSHGTGHAHLVPAMCRAAVAAECDGLIIEVHHDPEHALSDGAQSLTPTALAQLMPVMKKIAEAIGRDL
jgi:3-deoxy-7-phosphoheptulonate synthase